MKVFILGILLVCLYCIEGAVVKREAEEEQAATTTSPFLSYFPGLADTFSTYAAETKALFQKLQERFAGEQVTERLTQAFNTMLESAKNAMQ